MELSLEDIELKIEEMEDSFMSLKEFTLNQLHMYGQRDKEIRDEMDRLSKKLSDIESRQTSDVSEIREEMDKLSNSYSEMQSRQFSDVAEIRKEIDKMSYSSVTPKSPLKCAPLASSTPVQTAPRNPFAVTFKGPPKELEDVTDIELKESLKTYIPKYRDQREKLNKVQVAFVNKWLDDYPDIKGRREDGRRLFESGIKRGMWDRSSVAEGITEPVIWFSEKIRTILRKQCRKVRRKVFRKNTT